MQRTLKYGFLLFIISFIIPTVTVYAKKITCNYDNSNLEIVYETDDNSYKVTYGDIVAGSYKTNIIIAKWGASQSVENIYLDQSYINYLSQNYACPTEVHIGMLTVSSVSTPGVYSLAELVNQIIFPTDIKEYGDAWALMDINSKTFFVVDDITYSREYAKYVGGYLELIGSDSAKKGIAACQLDIPIIGEVAEVVCGLGRLAFDATLGEGLTLGSYKITSDLGIAKYIGPYVPINTNCDSLDVSLLEHQKYIADYKNCGSNNTCKVDNLNKINDIEGKLKNLCNAYLQNYNYNGGQEYCISSCLNLSEMLNSQKKDTDLYEEQTDGQCGFSQNLAGWLLNILRIGKYIVPALVIILSIIDFLKAIGADKDDEMKKAQSRFVKRLIAAALIFIVPFIIEFVLDKAGFGNYIDGCGIIDL